MPAAGKRFTKFGCNNTAAAVCGITGDADSHNTLNDGKRYAEIV
jgi:hypothetical protein